MEELVPLLSGRVSVSSRTKTATRLTCLFGFLPGRRHAAVNFGLATNWYCNQRNALKHVQLLFAIYQTLTIAAKINLYHGLLSWRHTGSSVLCALPKHPSETAVARGSLVSLLAR